jgi:Amiloride-sensitive sodium channel
MKKNLTKFVSYFYENVNENICLVNTQPDLLFSANFGGTVGLCIGFSLLSVAEIVYFFSMRPYNDLGPML